MGREEFKKRILENKIFNEQKNEYLKNIESLKRKYKGYDVDYTEVYRKITNYQIKRYGTSLHCYRDIYTKEDGERLQKNSEKRHHYRKNRGN